MIERRVVSPKKEKTICGKEWQRHNYGEHNRHLANFRNETTSISQWAQAQHLKGFAIQFQKFHFEERTLSNMEFHATLDWCSMCEWQCDTEIPDPLLIVINENGNAASRSQKHSLTLNNSLRDRFRIDNGTSAHEFNLTIIILMLAVRSAMRYCWVCGKFFPEFYSVFRVNSTSSSSNSSSRAIVRASKCFHSIFWTNWSNSDNWQRSTTTTNYIDWQFQQFSTCFLLNPVVRLIDKNLLRIDAIVIELIRFINSTVKKSMIDSSIGLIFRCDNFYSMKRENRNFFMECQRMSIVVQQPKTKASKRKRWQQRFCIFSSFHLSQDVCFSINWQWWSSVCWKTLICIT